VTAESGQRDKSPSNYSCRLLEKDLHSELILTLNAAECLILEEEEKYENLAHHPHFMRGVNLTHDCGDVACLLLVIASSKGKISEKFAVKNMQECCSVFVMVGLT
jgi:hypothetical protein